MTMRWTTRAVLMKWLLGSAVAGFLIYQWLPMVTLGVLSFSGPDGGTTFPMNGVSLHWYAELWEPSLSADFKAPLARSFMLALACSATTALMALAAAQAVRGEFRGNGVFFYLILLGIMAPGLLVGFGVAIVSRLLGITLSWSTTTFLVHVTWTLPFGFLTMLAVFNRFDRRLEEAALTLGATRLQAFRRVTLPIVLPGVIGAALFGFSLSYDEFARSLFTTGSDLTLPLTVLGQFDRQLTPSLYAVGTLTTLFSLTTILLFGGVLWLARGRARKPV
jgi:putative spermidine/putrescine transport system permease protein